MLTKLRFVRCRGQLLGSTVISICILISTISILCDAFNLENRLPIVKRGDNGTYFGYSVASHIVTETEDGSDEKW